MYPQTLQTLYFLDAQRLLEIHRFQKLMEKHRHVCHNDVYEPIRRLAAIDNVRQSPGKPLTSFKISDILAAENGNHSASKASSETSISLNNDNNSNSRRSSSLHDRSLFPTNTNDKISITSNTHPDTNSSNNNQRLPSVRDIYKAIPNKTSPTIKTRIIRPWSRSPPLTSPSSDDGSEDSSRNSYSQDKSLSNGVLKAGNNRIHVIDDEEYIDVEHCDDDGSDTRGRTSSGGQLAEKDVSPLDALMAMSSKTFKGLEDFDKQRQGDQDNGKSHVPKKKRKTRTAFTNQQIYELEKRFIMQKYLTPADRDEISAKLGLSSAQVITWFQNRRAKFKRDIEEMKNDVGAGSPATSENTEKDVT